MSDEMQERTEEAMRALLAAFRGTQAATLIQNVIGAELERNRDHIARLEAEREKLVGLLSEAAPWVRAGLDYEAQEQEARELLSRIELADAERDGSG